MRLVEYDLDLEYVVDEKAILSIMRESGCDIQEATQKNYEINWKLKRKDFSSQTRCISSFFSRIIGSIDTKDCKKLLIKCVPEVQGNKVMTYSGGFCDVQIQFDYDSFVVFDDLAKKKATLELLMEGIRTVAKDKGWDMEPFESTYNKIVEAGYINEWFLPKSAKSPDKKAVARVFLQHEVSEINISIIVIDKKGNEIFRQKVISELPDEWYYTKHLGELKWVSENEIVLVNQEKDKEYKVSTGDILSGLK